MNRFIMEHFLPDTKQVSQLNLKTIRKLFLFVGTCIYSFLFVFISNDAFAAVSNFTGNLDVVMVDEGTGIYSGTPLGTDFSGVINAYTANGSISNGTTTTYFSCCIAAGGLSVTNNEVLDEDTVSVLNTLAGSNLFNVGEQVDIINIEGDTTTSGSGRIEIGLSYIFSADTFIDESLDNYPFDPNDVLISLFFIAEHDSLDNDVYSAVGQLTCGESNADGDGYKDLCDNCLNTPNNDQLDNDLDGIGDACDNCPNTSNNDQMDNDLDGIGDACDNCPDDPDKMEPGICGCGVSEETLDTDGDGSINCFDSDDDNDGLSDLEEVNTYLTDPLNHDTDIDGLDDGIEVFILGTNPLLADTDGNGIQDGDEDSDADGFTNAEEIQCGSDPLDSSSKCFKGLPFLMLLLD